MRVTRSTQCGVPKFLPGLFGSGVEDGSPGKFETIGRKVARDIKAQPTRDIQISNRIMAWEYFRTPGDITPTKAWKMYGR